MAKLKTAYRNKQQAAEYLEITLEELRGMVETGQLRIHVRKGQPLFKVAELMVLKSRPREDWLGAIIHGISVTSLTEGW